MFGLQNPLALGFALVAGAVLPLAAGAQAAPSAEAATAAVSAGGEAQVVARDPDTGKLRAATAEEVQALRSARAGLRRSAAPIAEARSHWSGARGARLSDEFMNYSVVVKMPDGRLVELCVEDARTASSMPRAAVTAKSFELPTE